MAYYLRSQQKNIDVEKKHSEVMIHNEKATAHLFLRKEYAWDPSNPATLNSQLKAVIPQALDLVNQTVSISKNPQCYRYFRKYIVEYERPSSEQTQRLYHAIGLRDSQKERKSKEAEKLKVKERALTDEAVTTQTKMWLRIAKARNIKVETLIDPEYAGVKDLDRDQKRVGAFKEIDTAFAGKGESTDSS